MLLPALAPPRRSEQADPCEADTGQEKVAVGRKEGLWCIRNPSLGLSLSATQEGLGPALTVWRGRSQQVLGSKTFASHFILHFLQMTAPLDTCKSLLTLLLWMTLTFLHPSQDFIFLSASSKKHPLGTHTPQEET